MASRPARRAGSLARPLHLSGEGEVGLPDSAGKEPVPVQPQPGSGEREAAQASRPCSPWDDEGVRAQPEARAGDPGESPT